MTAALQSVSAEAGEVWVPDDEHLPADILLDTLQNEHRARRLSMLYFETLDESDSAFSDVVRRKSSIAPLIGFGADEAQELEVEPLDIDFWEVTTLLLHRLIRRTRMSLVISAVVASIAIVIAFALVYSNQGHTQIIFAVHFGLLMDAWMAVGTPFCAPLWTALQVFPREYEQGLVSVPSVIISTILWLAPITTGMTALSVAITYSFTYADYLELDRWGHLTAINAINGFHVPFLLLLIVSMMTAAKADLITTIVSYMTFVKCFFGIAGFFVPYSQANAFLQGLYMTNPAFWSYTALSKVGAAGLPSRCDDRVGLTDQLLCYSGSASGTLFALDSIELGAGYIAVIASGIVFAFCTAVSYVSLRFAVRTTTVERTGTARPIMAHEPILVDDALSYHVTVFEELPKGFSPIVEGIAE
eukprot:m.13074 g.13074  ORF g.13074 m.13074 type:complete len:416 (-) comp10089_c0_seq2:65-1312(-)